MARPETTDFDKEILKQVSINLSRLIRQKGWTKKRLAEESDIKPSTLSGYFGEKYNISPGNLQKLADTLGVAKGDIDPRYNIDGEQIMDFLNYIYKIKPIDLSVDNNSDPDFEPLWVHKISDLSLAAIRNSNSEAIDSVIKNRQSKAASIKIAPSAIRDIDIDLLQVEAKHSQKALANYINCANELISIISKFTQREKIQQLSAQIEKSLITADTIQREYEEIYKSHGGDNCSTQTGGCAANNSNI